MNNYAIGKEKIMVSFEIKGFKKWVGREGYGAQGTVYQNGFKIAFVTDEGNGGNIDVVWQHLNSKTVVTKFLAKLPSYTWGEYYPLASDIDDENRIWDFETFGDVMLQFGEYQQNFKKAMNKVCYIPDPDLYGIMKTKITKKELDDLKKLSCIKVAVKNRYPKSTILNLLDVDKAFALWMKYSVVDASQNGQPIAK